MGRGQQSTSSNPTRHTEGRSGELSGCVTASPQHMLTVRWKRWRRQLSFPTAHRHCHHPFPGILFPKCFNWSLSEPSFLGHEFSILLALFYQQYGKGKEEKYVPLTQKLSDHGSLSQSQTHFQKKKKKSSAYKKKIIPQ